MSEQQATYHHQYRGESDEHVDEDGGKFLAADSHEFVRTSNDGGSAVQLRSVYLPLLLRGLELGRHSNRLHSVTGRVHHVPLQRPNRSANEHRHPGRQQPALELRLWRRKPV